MNIYRLDCIDEAALACVGGKARGLYSLSKAGLNIPEGFVAVGVENEKDLQKIADFCATAGLNLVAVRSSAAAEDGADFSSAGQYETFLNLSSQNAVKKAVQDCLDSLASRTAQSYANYFTGAKSSAMAVIVQNMIVADVAGVCFTEAPDGDGLLIEAVAGTGENLVGGKAKAHTYRSPSDYPAQGDSLLSDFMIGRIAEEAKLARTNFGCELDMEWAVKNGILYWLQARPITQTERIDAFELDARDFRPDGVLTTCNVGEMLPGAVTPLSLSTSVASIDFGMRKMIVKAGAAKNYAEIPKGSCVTNCGNHLFINITALYAIADSVLGATREGVELSLCGRILTETPKPPVPPVSNLKKADNARRYFGILFGVRLACRKIKKLAEKSSIPVYGDARAQIHAISDRLGNMDEAFWLHYIASAYSGSMSSAIFLILLNIGYGVDDARALMAGVLEDIEGIESVDILRSLRKVAKTLLQENPDAVAYSPEELAGYLRTCGNKTRQAIEAFLNRHGHRAIREAELRSGSWRDDEVSLGNYIKSILVAGIDENPREHTVNDNVQEMLRVQKGILRPLTRFIIAQARNGVVHREYTKSMSIKVLDKFKTAYRHLAGLLVNSGVLPDSDLIFFLTHQEIEELIGGDIALVKKATARRRVFEEQKQFRFTEVCIGKPQPVTINYEAMADGRALAGSSISRGKATGKARVVKSVEEANQLQKGEIMVASFTDIGWSPYYCMLGALVTEVGSALSHGAVVAREYALPLVSNVPYATEVIKTGDLISVDGNNGRVLILK